MRRIWQRKWRTLGALALFVFLVGNFFTWRHARAMFRYDTEATARTASAEKLSGWDKAWVLLNGVTLPKPQNGFDPAKRGFEFETHRFANSRGDELESWLISGDSDTLILFFHGYSAAKADLLGMADIVHPAGHSCVFVDFFGSGGSSGSMSSFGYLEAGDVAAAVTHYRAKFPDHKIVLFGISMGGAAVMRACSEMGVEADGIVVESTFPHFRETVAKRFELMNLPSFPAADLLLFWGGIDLGINPREHNPIDYAKKIEIPTLVMTGKRDHRVPVENVAKMAANLPQLHEYRVFDAGHRPFCETNCEEWSQLMLEFIDSLNSDSR